MKLNSFNLIVFKVTASISVKTMPHEKPFNDLNKLTSQTPWSVKSTPIQSTIHHLNVATTALKKKIGKQENGLLKGMKDSEKKQVLNVTH